MARRVYEDDDGRTIADMSGIERQPMIVPRLPKREKKKPIEVPEEPVPEQEPDPVPKHERRALVLGAMSATTLIALIFIIAAAAVIGLLLLVWSR